MPAVETQQLAQIADLVLTGPPVAALAMLSEDVRNAQLRKASGQVLAAYGVRFGRVRGSSFKLATWGDFTKGLVIDLAVYALLGTSRGFNPETADGKAIVRARDEAKWLLDEISDIANKFPRFDPDATDATPGYEEEGALACSEGGPLDQADAWAHAPPGAALGLGGIGGGGFP
jgi:hypothetical protein